MFTVTRLVLLVALGTLPLAATEQKCDQLRSGSAEAATRYLGEAPDEPEAARCVEIAFHQIASLPRKRAIPLLISYLGYKRPLDEGERHGFFIRPKTPDLLYPAVHQLYLLGSAAEGPLIRFIAEGADASGSPLDNAIYTLLLIRQGDVVTVIRKLHDESSASKQATPRERLQSAARLVVNRWCIDKQTRTACEEELW